ncbi:YIP1 family protein [Halorutilales archaeon Cl-col2-1]
MKIRRAVSDWYAVVTQPREFFSRVNHERAGQRDALVFVVLVALVSEVPTAVPEGVVDAAGVSVAVLLLSPAVLHIASGVVYGLVWLATERDEGVDTTVRAVAYSTAPAVVSWLPYVRLPAAVYGFYLLYTGIREGHGVGRARALGVASVPGLLVFGVVFSGFEGAREVFGALLGVGVGAA